MAKLEKLKKQQEALSTKIQIIENKEKARQNNYDTKRKLLIGNYYLEQARQNNTYNSLCSIMDSYLTKNSDRALFNLKPCKQKKQNEKK